LPSQDISPHGAELMRQDANLMGFLILFSHTKKEILEGQGIEFYSMCNLSIPACAQLDQHLKFQKIRTRNNIISS
jgi:hypothetical protein